MYSLLSKSIQNKSTLSSRTQTRNTLSSFSQLEATARCWKVTTRVTKMELTAIPPDATSPTEVVPTLTKPVSGCQKCRSLCGRESILLLFLVAFIAGGHAYVFAAYDGGLRRKWLWVFLLLSILSWALALSFIVRTVCVACFKEKPVEKEQSHSKRKVSWLKVLKAKYNSVLDVNGKYYLIKMLKLKKDFS